MKYCWKSTSFNADAEKVGNELSKIENEGDLTRENVLEYAKNKNTELNKCFEWNDTIAGEKYRLFQASSLLASISIVIQERPEVKKQRVYVNIIDNSKEIKVFKNIVSVLDNDDEYKQLIDKAERDFVNYKEKYNDLIKLQDLKNIIYKNI